MDDGVCLGNAGHDADLGAEHALRFDADGHVDVDGHIARLIGGKGDTCFYAKHSVLKSTDITLPTKVCVVKAIIFLVVMYGCETWTIKKAGCQRIDAFELWCWRRFFF